MVKNTHGGNKSKCLARKLTVDNPENRKLRLSNSDLELYAVATRLLGHGMFYAMTNDGNTLLGRIRNKFRGRSKHSNNIMIGSLLLVGLREWEAPNFKECDLLEVYDLHEIKQIKKIVDIHTLEHFIDSCNNTKTDYNNNDFDFDFNTDNNNELIDNNEKQINNDIDNDDIDFDDI